MIYLYIRIQHIQPWKVWIIILTECKIESLKEFREFGRVLSISQGTVGIQVHRPITGLFPTPFYQLLPLFCLTPLLPRSCCLGSISQTGYPYKSLSNILPLCEYQLSPWMSKVGCMPGEWIGCCLCPVSLDLLPQSHSFMYSPEPSSCGSAALQPSLFTRRSSSKILALPLTWCNQLFREKINILIVLTACHFSSFYQYSMNFKMCLKGDSPVISFILLKRLQWFLIV